jgi:hypothetical protein
VSKRGARLLVDIGREVADVQVGREGVAVIKAAVAIDILPAGALLAPQPLPLLARLLLPV